jgi:hypothetical protein
MPTIRHLTRALGACAGLFCAALAPAQDRAPAPRPDDPGERAPAPAEFTKGTVFVVERAALADLFPDAKDRGCVSVFSMLPARIRELPREVQDPGFTPEVAGIITTMMTMASHPARLSVVYNGEAPTGGLFGYGVAISVLGDTKDEIDQIQARVGGLLAKNENLPLKPSQRFQGMTDYQLPFGLVSFGPRQAADGWRYEIIAGTMDNPDAAAASLPRPERGLDPVFRAYFAGEGLTPAFSIVQTMAGQNPKAAEGLAKARARLGDARIAFQAGYTKDAYASTLAYVGAREHAEELMVSTEPLSRADFGAIPADATDATMKRAADDWLTRTIDNLAGAEPVQRALAQFQQVTGVSLRDDLAAALGGTVAFYMSDSTGGAGLGSAVGLISIRDHEKLAGTLGKLAAFANTAGESHAKGYVRIASWDDGKSRLMSLRFPGLPVPLELTLGVTDRWLCVAMTPQAALAAVRQASGSGDEGLLANPVFRKAFPGDKVVGFSFTDTARACRSGYTLLSLVTSAASNLVRSPTDPTRNPPMALPLFNDFVRNVRPRLSTTFWRAGDLVTQTTADHSALVQLSGAVGSIGKFAPVLVAAAAAAAGFEQQQQHRMRSALDGAGELSAPMRFLLEAAAMPVSPERAALLAGDAAGWMTLSGNGFGPAPEPAR